VVYWDDIGAHIGKATVDAFWLSHPAVRARVNERISGDARRGPLDWFATRMAGRLPFSEGLSVGCGTGGLERDLIRRGICRAVTGIDTAQPPLDYAKERAREEGLADAIRYERADAMTFLDAGRTFGAVFFHAALHHFERPADLLGRVARALCPGGILYLDDFIGPSMNTWSWRRLFLPNLVYYLLPPKVRRPGLVRSPVNPEDPTEAVAAGEILPALDTHFRILERRDYGGQLTSLIYPNLARPDGTPRSPAPERFDRAVRLILRIEDRLMRHRVWTRSRPFYAVIIAEAKEAARPPTASET